MVATALLALATAGAQNLNSAYFTDGYLYGYQLNPAFGNDKNFVAIPGIGNMDVSLSGTLHLTDVIYNIDGKTTTFMNPGVETRRFLDNLSNTNRIGTDLRINLLSGGFKAFKGYNTITISARANVGARLPREIFRLMKQGVENETYDISDLRASATAWGELALGHSHQINSKWRVGGTLKFMLGYGNVNAQLRDAQLRLGENAWDALTDAQIEASVKGLQYKHKINHRTGHEYVSGAKIDGGGLNGFGMGVDLGATYKINSDWTVSASILDLGFITWNNNMLATTNGVQNFTTDKYIFNVDGDATNSFSKEFDKVKDDLSALYELNNEGDQGKRTTMPGTTLNFAAEYTFPLYRKLTFGALSSTRIQGKFSWTDFRLSANVAPCKIFSAGVNLGMGTFGCSFGWILNLHCTGYNFFLASDHTPGRLAKQGVPLSSNANFALGMNIPF